MYKLIDYYTGGDYAKIYFSEDFIFPTFKTEKEARQYKHILDKRMTEDNFMFNNLAIIEKITSR